MQLKSSWRKAGDLNIVHILVLTSSLIVFFANNTVWAECPSGFWDCDDGQCIESDSLCDGEVNCKDGSDETAELCIANSCASYAFHCTYGGCVAGNAKCDGKKDCADNSDEMPRLCANDRTIIELERQLKGNCSESYMQCKSGECIDNMSKCDGQLDCRDGSDETVELCSFLSCPPYSFKCGYGGCIPGKGRCDGTVGCLVDGSDEAYKLCSTQRKRGIHKLAMSTSATSANTNPVTRAPISNISPPTTKTTTTTTRRPPPPPPPVENIQSCQLPSDSNMVIRNRITNAILKPGTFVSTNTIVRFECKESFTLVGRAPNFCDGNKWNQILPQCQKFCSTTPLTAALSTTITCELNGVTVQCRESVQPNTVAIVSCAPFFRPSGPTQNRLRCQSNGQWDYQKPKCIMNCGIVDAPTTKFSRGGTPININETPWHVGIFSNFSGKFINQCGGTILSLRLVLTAAHCFWDEANSVLFDKQFYEVVAGKHYSDYYNENEFVQRQSRPIAEIVLKLPYNDRDEAYRNDIAVLRLQNPFKFTASIRPICIEFERNARKEVRSGTVGKFVGWGVTENKTAADVLQSVSMQAISNSECSLLSNKNNYELPDDKFCLKDEYGKSACRGDSGGGFIVTKEYNTQQTYNYVIGIISHAPDKDQDCAREGVVALTNINFFERFIMDLVDKEVEDF